MPLSHDTITALAPDQASLKAAHGQMKPRKWLLRGTRAADDLVWGEVQGSGANPYRTVFNSADHGYKCTCPSRKFPCKHVLALMWMHVDDPGAFAEAEIPDWVNDWRSRRRKTGTAPAASGDGAAPTTAGKSLTAASMPEVEKAPDPKAAARARAAAEKRAAATEAALIAAAKDLEAWIADQLRTGLSGLLDELDQRCRAIAARMVDGKAQALGGRIDEMPARIAALPGEFRADALIAELGKLVILCRAFRATPADPELRRAVATAETREALLESGDAPRASGRWEVVGERVTTRRDGLVAQETWLQSLDAGAENPFALLLDFFPVALGKRGSAFTPGEQFEATLVFYPAAHPLRAQPVERRAVEGAPLPWVLPPVEGPEGEMLDSYLAAQDAAPWSIEAPVMLPAGRLCQLGGRYWWRAETGGQALPLRAPPPRAATGLALECSVALWDGERLGLLAARSSWGRVSFDA
ncbi:MAG: SWIM zinc finger family protein [Pseudomonadota bacterium]